MVSAISRVVRIAVVREQLFRTLIENVIQLNWSTRSERSWMIRWSLLCAERVWQRKKCGLLGLGVSLFEMECVASGSNVYEDSIHF